MWDLAGKNSVGKVWEQLLIQNKKAATLFGIVSLLIAPDEVK